MPGKEKFMPQGGLIAKPMSNMTGPLKSTYYYFNNHLKHDFCDDVVDYINSTDLEQALVTPNNPEDGPSKVDLVQRRTKVKLIEFGVENNTLERLITLEMWRIFTLVNNYYQYNIEQDTLTVQLTKYTSEDKGWYDWHQDDSLFLYKPRKLSISAVLRTAEKGGVFDLGDGGCSEFEQTIGSIIVFPSFMYHTVTPVEKGERYSIVAWVSGEPWR